MKLKDVQEAARRAAEEIERDWPQWKKDLSTVISRTEEKQASRDADAKDLATGEKTREDLWRENSFVPAEIARTPLDLSSITCRGRAARLPKR